MVVNAIAYNIQCVYTTDLNIQVLEKRTRLALETASQKAVPI